MRSILVSALMTLAATPAIALTPGEAGNLVNEAMSKGYGQLCSLEMMPVAAGGYYPCLDIGVYRFVAEYGRTRGFVLIPGQAPFEIFWVDGQGARFQVQGAWEADLPLRVELWWNDVVLGGRANQIASQTEAERNAAAGAAVDAYLKSLQPAAPDPTPAAPVSTQPMAPQVIYIVPPNYGAAPAMAPAQAPIAAQSDQIPITGVPFPSIGQQPMMPQPGGVLVAPGVVAYPQGTKSF